MCASNSSIPRRTKKYNTTASVKPRTNSAPEGDPLAAALFRAPVAPVISPVLANALWLHERGANVIPLPYGGPKHPPYKRGALAHTRLTREAVIELFPPRSNIAVITGRTSGNLASLDADSELAFMLIRQHLLERGLPMLITRSTRDALAGHFLFRLADGTLENANYALADGERLERVTNTKTQAAAVNVLGHDLLAVLPPSLNGERGKFYTWYTDQTEHQTPAIDAIPVYTLADLADLLPGLRLAVQRDKPATGKSYGQTALEGWVTEVTDAAPGGRNNTLNAGAYRLGRLAAGGEVNRLDAEYHLSQAAHAAGLHGAEVRDTIRSGLDAGEETPARRPYEVLTFGHTPERAALEAWIAAVDWRTLRRRATTTRAIAEALADRAGTARNGKWRASVRELAELARVSVPTTRTALETLTNSGAVARAGTDRRSGASLWTLGPAAPLKSKSKEPAAPSDAGLRRVTPNGGRAPGGCGGGGEDSNGNREFYTLTTLGSTSVQISRYSPRTAIYTEHAVPEDSDAAESGALGKNGWRVWRWLLAQPEPRTVAEIAAALTLTYSQARHALLTVQEKSPAGYPLVERTAGAWIANPMSGAALRDYVAEPHGTAGKGDARREKHAAERAQRAYLDVLQFVRNWDGYDTHLENMRAAGLLPGRVDPSEPPERDGAETPGEASPIDASAPGETWQTGATLRKPAARGAPQHAPDSDQLVRHKKRGAA